MGFQHQIAGIIILDQFLNQPGIIYPSIAYPNGVHLAVYDFCILYMDMAKIIFQQLIIIRIGLGIRRGKDAVAGIKQRADAGMMDGIQ